MRSQKPQTRTSAPIERRTKKKAKQNILSCAAAYLALELDSESLIITDYQDFIDYKSSPQ